MTLLMWSGEAKELMSKEEAKEVINKIKKGETQEEEMGTGLARRQ